MKKIIFLILILCINIPLVRGQLFVNNTPLSRYLTEHYVMGSNYIQVPFSTPKTLSSNDGTYKITLAYYYGNGNKISRFLYCPLGYDSITSNGTETIKYFDFPSGYTVTDFDILDDTIIFCGRAKTNNLPQEHCYIAYESILNLFNSTGITFTMTDLMIESLNKDTILSINKIKAYRDKNDVITIAGIGTMYYGLPDTCAIDTIIGNSASISWKDQEKHYYQYLMFYKKANSWENLEPMPSTPAASATQMVLANQVYFYRNPQYSIDTLGDNLETFEDIAVTDNYVWLGSTIYYDTTDSTWRKDTTPQTNYPPVNVTNTFVLRQFDKNTYANSGSKRSDITYYNELPVYGFKMADLYNDNLALSYVRFQAGYTIAMIQQIENFDIKKTQYIVDTIYSSNQAIYDMEYCSGNNRLLVLKNCAHSNPYPAYSDRVIHIDLDQDLNMLYTTKREYMLWHDAYRDDKMPYRWYDIVALPDNEKHYALTGILENDLQFLNKSLVNDHDSSCVVTDNALVYVDNSYHFLPFSNLDNSPLCYEHVGYGDIPSYLLNYTIQISTLGSYQRPYHISEITMENIGAQIMSMPIPPKCESNQ